MDSQVVELLGRNRLIDELLRAGLEIALPIRDRGVDLIAYVDKGDGVSAFAAVPIQMKASSQQAFGVHAKYASFPNLLLAYIWHIDAPEQEITFALTYPEAFAVADAMGWTATPSWQSGAYTTSRPSARLRELLEPYRMTPKRWRERIAAMSSYGG